MIKLSGVFKSFYIIIPVVILAVLGIIIFNSPYYAGFEAGLSYLSPDLSENRTVIRDSIELKRTSKIKIVFERKGSFSLYSRSDFKDFIDDLHVEIWNDNEYFQFKDRDLEFIETDKNSFVIPIGRLKEKGKYYIYIKSNNGVTPFYHIGIGIGRESGLRHFGYNVRNFY